MNSPYMDNLPHGGGMGSSLLVMASQSLGGQSPSCHVAAEYHVMAMTNSWLALVGNGWQWLALDANYRWHKPDDFQKYI